MSRRRAPNTARCPRLGSRTCFSSSPRRGGRATMPNDARVSRERASSSGQGHCQFVWPLGKSPIPDEMNTSVGPRTDADRWDFRDGLALPAPVGTPVHAMAAGVVHRAGPADTTGPGQGFGSTHVLLRATDPTDGQDDLFLVYIHLDS